MLLLARAADKDALFSVFKALDDMNRVNMDDEVDDDGSIVVVWLNDESVVRTMFTCEQVTMKVK